MDTQTQTVTVTAPVTTAYEAGKTVFIIEDDHLLVQAYSYIFKQEGIPVLIAITGTEAQQMMQDMQELPKVVLLDLMLPGVSGFDLLQQMGADVRWKAVPVIILSNLAREDDVQRGKSLGAVDYLIKANTDITSVVARVKEFLK